LGAPAWRLHDEIGLGLSIHEFSATGAGWPRAIPFVRAAVASTLVRRPELSPYVFPLVVHHLVWRINQCEARPTRQAVRARLMSMMTELIESGDPYLFDGAR
jgi:hypothetical protein